MEFIQLFNGHWLFFGYCPPPMFHHMWAGQPLAEKLKLGYFY
jgi:hypothetical protein